MKIKKTKLESLIMLAIAVAASVLCGNRYGVSLAQFIFLIFALRFIMITRSCIGWLLLTLTTTTVLTIVDWGIVPGDSILIAALPWFLTMLVTALSMLIHKLITQRLDGFTGTLILPSIYTVLSYIYAMTNVFGTWDQMAYKFYGCQELLQIVSVTGLWGIGFLVTWIASVVNWSWQHRSERTRINKGLAILLAAVFLILLSGQIRLNTADIYEKTVKVAGITISKEIDESLDEEYGGWEGLMDCVRNGSIDAEAIKPKLDRFSDDMFEKTVTAAKGGAKIIFWAEASGYVLQGDEAALIERGKQVCKDYNIYLGLSSYALYNKKENRIDGKYINNHIVFLSPEGEVLADSPKKRPVPGPEAESLLRSAEAIPVVQTQFGKVSFAICFDGDFQRVIRDGREAALFFLPSKDWDAITPVHSEMASCRALENGFSLVRVASLGQSAAYDSLGRTIAVTSDFSSKDGSIMYADVPVHSGCTIYELFGDYFPIMSFIVFLALTVYGFISKRRAAGN